MACTSVPDERMTSYADFPETRELTARTLSLDSALFRYPYRVRIQDDKAVVLDLHGTEAPSEEKVLYPQKKKFKGCCK